MHLPRKEQFCSNRKKRQRDVGIAGRPFKRKVKERFFSTKPYYEMLRYSRGEFNNK